jgi:hypothetical protein
VQTNWAISQTKSVAAARPRSSFVLGVAFMVRTSIDSRIKSAAGQLD